MLSLEDRLAIMEVIALHGHLVDDGRLDELNRVFAEDVTHDLTAFGLGIHQGLGSVQEAAEALVHFQVRSSGLAIRDWALGSPVPNPQSPIAALKAH